MEIDAWPIGAHVPSRQNSPGGHSTCRTTQAPVTHRVLQQGSPLVCTQSASAVQPPVPPAVQHSPLPQQVVPAMQATMKNVQNPSWQIPPVQGSASPSWQSASWVQVICATLVCAAADLPLPIPVPAMTPTPIRRNVRRRSVVVAQSRAMRSNTCPSTLTFLPVAPSSLSATPEPSMSFFLLTRSCRKRRRCDGIGPKVQSTQQLRIERHDDRRDTHQNG